MGYYRTLLTKWSRRDRLAVLVVALAVAFLTGTALVVLAVGSSTAGIAAEYGATAAVTEHATVAEAHATAGPETIILPLATADTSNGTATVVGVPGDADRAPVELGGNSTTLGTISREQRVRLQGTDATVTLDVRPRGQSTFPRDWYVTDAATAEELGTDGALAVSPAEDVPSEGVPLVGALPFFVAGTREVLAALGIAAVVGGVLVGVTVYNVTRMAVRDRVRELFVLRATGTTRWQVRRLFLTRATLLVGIGVAAGYALGVILTNAAINVAVTAGLPTSLDVGFTRQAIEFLLPTYAGVMITGWLAALAAVQPAVSEQPVRLTDTAMRLRPEGIGPQIIDSRAAIPTAATLAAFVVFLLVVAGLAGVAGPLATADEATITEPGSTHPIASQVPESYATPLRDRGIAASPEILLFMVRDGQPFLARGADYDAFADVSETRLVDGREPQTPDEAVVGTDAAETLDVDVGDRILLGGSVRPRVARVRIVGTFDGDGPTDDQVLVSLPTARHLSSAGDGQVNFIRAERLPETGRRDRTAQVTDVTAPGTVPRDESFEVAVTVRNDALRTRTVSRTVRFAGEQQRIEVAVPANGQRSANVTFEATEPGTVPVRVGNVSRSVEIVPPDAIRLRDVPDRAPPDSAPLVRVVDARGGPAPNATVTVGNRTVAVRNDGTVRLPFDAAGNYTIRAARGNRTDTATVSVEDGVDRSVRATLRISPATPATVVAPEAVVTLSNPWNRTLERDLTVRGPDVRADRAVELQPGETIRFEQGLPRRPPGSYDVTVETATHTLATATYRVTGDDRVIAALATGGRSGTTGIGRAAQVAFGNVELALVVLVVLGGAMAIGATSATFAGAVHANTAVVGLLRAVGATRREVASLFIGDAIRLGGVAIVGAMVVATLAVRGLDALGYLTAYGIRLATRPSPGVFYLITLGAFAIIIGGAFVAAVAVLSATPAELLRGGDQG